MSKGINGIYLSLTWTMAGRGDIVFNISTSLWWYVLYHQVGTVHKVAGSFQADVYILLIFWFSQTFCICWLIYLAGALLTYITVICVKLQHTFLTLKVKHLLMWVIDCVTRFIFCTHYIWSCIPTCIATLIMWHEPKIHLFNSYKGAYLCILQ